MYMICDMKSAVFVTDKKQRNDQSQLPTVRNEGVPAQTKALSGWGDQVHQCHKTAQRCNKEAALEPGQAM